MSTLHLAILYHACIIYHTKCDYCQHFAVHVWHEIDAIRWLWRVSYGVIMIPFYLKDVKFSRSPNWSLSFRLGSLITRLKDVTAIADWYLQFLPFVIQVVSTPLILKIRQYLSNWTQPSNMIWNHQLDNVALVKKLWKTQASTIPPSSARKLHMLGTPCFRSA